MNTKFVAAVLFALVSVSMCEIPAPSQELVQKYEEYRSTFYKRLLTAYNKYLESATSNPDNSERVKAVKDFMGELQTKPEFQTALKIASNLGAEAAPLVEKARFSALGMYEYYLRPYIGDTLSSTITDLKVYLDKFMPTE